MQINPSKFPLPTAELFTILDDASEKTFLCAGTGSKAATGSTSLLSGNYIVHCGAEGGTPSEKHR